jgi:hypothetical protein
MPKRAVTIAVDNERLTFYAEDWPAIKASIERAISTAGNWHKARGERAMVAAIGFTVAEKSRLVARKPW